MMMWCLARPSASTRNGVGRHNKLWLDFIIFALHLTVYVTGAALSQFAPRFGDDVPTNVSTRVETTVRLNCRVWNLGTRTVSWLRWLDAPTAVSDTSLLTVGRMPWTTDERFQVLHGADSPDWTLQIKLPGESDQGRYECQVSTAPKMSFVVALNVVVGDVEIVGSDIVDTGTTLVLRCTVTGPSPPDYVDWFLNGTALTKDAASGVAVAVKKAEARTQSTLTVRRVKRKHAGNYTCRASSAETDYHLVRVVKGRKPSGLRAVSAAAWPVKEIPLVCTTVLTSTVLWLSARLINT